MNAAYSFVSPTPPHVDDVSDAWAAAVKAGQIQRPTGVLDPKLEKALAGWSSSCAALFDLDSTSDPAGAERDSVIEVLGGFVSDKDALWKGMKPYAMCYGGHQFGSWAGQLGDGRAISLGEYVNKTGQRWEIQLKGAGKTPYSRFADGRAVLRSSVREFLCSEAMNFLGVPTTRALSLVTTGAGIIRDMFYDGDPRMEPGAVVARVSPSFLRLGNFQLAFSRGDTDLLKEIADYALRYHYQHILDDVKEGGEDDEAKYAKLLREIAQKNAYMVARWQGVGFVHGVMNTDNFSILGLTIDYGPYGFLDEYDPSYTPNTTDLSGKRYKFEAQPTVAHWNIMQFAKTFVPLCGEAAAVDVVKDFSEMFKQAYTDVMRQKLGFAEWVDDGDEELLLQFQECMRESRADFTNTWRSLAAVTADCTEEELEKWCDELELFSSAEQKTKWMLWLDRYQKRVKTQLESGAFGSDDERVECMNKVNPVYILRNYLAQTAIEKAEIGDYSEIKRLYDLLSSPYERQDGMDKYTTRPPQWAKRKGVCMNSCSS